MVQVDILHPLTSLEWRQCRGPPVSVSRVQNAVWLKDKVYVAGGELLQSRRADARLYIYTPATDTWDTQIDTPVYSFILTTYHSQLVLVGGKKYISEYGNGETTNKLWTLCEDGQWQETLPPIPTQCGSIHASAVSHGDHLFVITATDDYPSNKVYVYNGHHWASAQHPPQRLDFMKSTISNRHWYLMGGELLGSPSQQTFVYSASLDSVLASCQPSETSQPSSVWKRLTDIPHGYCCPAVFGNRLIAVKGGGYPITPTFLHAYSSFTQSWVHMGDGPDTSQITPCVVALSSNELMVTREQRTFKVTLKSKLILVPNTTPIFSYRGLCG